VCVVVAGHHLVSSGNQKIEATHKLSEMGRCGKEGANSLESRAEGNICMAS